MINFNSAHLPAPSHEYVAWVDVMGVKASMGRSIAGTANFVFKLHIAAIQAKLPGVRLYPVMDGFYASAADSGVFQTFLRNVFGAVAEEFNGTIEMKHRFAIRGGLAFGPVYHGESVGPGASNVLATNAAHRDAILLGMPMVQAHVVESSAPPFGIAVHESARTFAPPHVDPIHSAWWHWRHATTLPAWTALPNAFTEYLNWCRARAEGLEYPEARIDVHRKLFNQFLALAS